ncbi:MAG TPA: 1,4-alpha-glucan branching enzyme, partial [Prosthecobacter sp.]|nr:1,4-alpha-glucan branching enzyme [Prosthecobacter sp.]
MSEDFCPLPEMLAILEARHNDPFAFLGRHRLSDGTVVVRTFQPTADAVTVLGRDGSGPWPMRRMHHHGFYAVALPESAADTPYDLEIRMFGGRTKVIADTYSFTELILGDQDVYFFREGSHQRLYDCMGARPRVMNGVAGTQFAVWAPNAR